MNWITAAGRRFWQAYSQGLELSCPMRRTLAVRVAERNRKHDAASNAGPAPEHRTDGRERPALH
ncbi:hypothetical protein ACFQFS_16905 [Novosphingobium lubricantis]